MIIVIEGCDAVGKATQSRLLAERLKGTRFTFPNYETETGRAILSHLKQEWACSPLTGVGLSGYDALVFQCVQVANRLEILPEIWAALSRGPVVFDRYWQSGYVYGSLDGLDKEWLVRVLDKPMPPADINILIDIPLEESFKRRPERRDRYETDKDYLERVCKGYLRLWGERSIDSKISKSRWRIVDGIGTVEEVSSRIVGLVEEWRGS